MSGVIRGTLAQLTGYRIKLLLEEPALIEFWSVAFASRDLQQGLNVRFFPFGVVRPIVPAKSPYSKRTLSRAWRHCRSRMMT
jgi:hypothetical protein